MVVPVRKRTRSKSAPPPRRSSAPPPPPPAQAQAPAFGGISMLDSLKHGVGVGAGVEVSRQIIQGITGGTSRNTEEVITYTATPNNTPESKSCQLVYENMMSCIQDKDMESCDLYIQNYRNCTSQQ